MRRAEGGAKNVGVFRVKNHDFTPKNSYFSNFMGGGELRAPPGSSPVEYIIFVRVLLVNGGNSFHGIKNKSKHTTLSA